MMLVSSVGMRFENFEICMGRGPPIELDVKLGQANSRVVFHHLYMIDMYITRSGCRVRTIIHLEKYIYIIV